MYKMKIEAQLTLNSIKIEPKLKKIDIRLLFD